MDMGKTVGPLPMGAWVIVVGAGLAIAYTTRKSGSTATPSTVTDTSGTPGVGTGQYTQTNDGVSGVPVATATTPGTDPGTPSNTITDNETWSRAAVDYLIGNNYPAALSYSAITKALAGSQMSVSEYSLWQVALRGLGTPPQPVIVSPPTTGLPGPVIPKPPPPKKGVKYYTIRHGDTLAHIAAKFHGTTWSSIRHYNSFLSHMGAHSSLNKYVGKKIKIG